MKALTTNEIEDPNEAITAGATTTVGADTDDPTPDEAMTTADIEAVYAWLPPAALQLFIEAWPVSGNAAVAWAAVRDDDRYEQWFPGNMTEDGRPRYSEDVYATVTASYDDVFRALGLTDQGMAAMKTHYGELIQGDVSPRELEENRVTPMYERVIIGSEAIRAWYSTEYDIQLTTQDLLVAALDPSLGNQILSQQISFAEIGGEAAESGYDISLDLIDRLYRSKEVDRDVADRLFEGAARVVPVLNVLANRHADPDDEFDLESFVDAEIFQNPAERRRMRRLVAQEQSQFANTTASLRRDQRTGGVGGVAAS